jgi:hypothetical protein
MSARAFTSELAGLIGPQGELVRALAEFNQDPAAYLHETRRADFFPAGAREELWEYPLSRRHLSRHILERIGGELCLDAKRPEWAVALLDSRGLDRLARHVAGALVGPRVRRSLSRSEVLRWRDWLEADALDFALTRAGLLPFHAQADAGAGTALDLGRAWIVAASRRWHDAISRRFLLKLPAGDLAQADAVDGALAARLVSSVLSIVEPRWCSSFATMRI